MLVQMSEKRLQFWQALLSPFPDSLLSVKPARGGGKELTWLDKRAIANRLDSICGPDGWRTEYTPTERGFKCRLYLYAPTNDGGYEWAWKEDGAGTEEMQAQDDDEKSGYTNAFRRAAQDAWGIGRYLYRKGIPLFLDPEARPFEENPGHSVQAAKPRTSTPRPATTSEYGGAGATTQKTTTATIGGMAPAEFKLPEPGPAVYSWAKNMGVEFSTDLVKHMRSIAERVGVGSTFTKWDKEAVDAICLDAVRNLRTLPSYKGQFEHLFQGKNAAPVQAPDPSQKPTNDGVNVADLRKLLATNISALIRHQTGEEPTVDKTKAAFINIASLAANSEGHKGEVPASLRDLTDIVWLRNMLDVVAKQISEAANTPALEDDEIPF